MPVTGHCAGPIFIDRAADAVPLLSMVYRAPNPTAAIFDITFRGKLNADGKSIAGTWTEGNQSFPVSFATRALQRSMSQRSERQQHPRFSQGPGKWHYGGSSFLTPPCPNSPNF